MIDATRTTTALLQGLHDVENQAVWTEFDGRYRPILVAFARRLGLHDSDAADVAQETLLQFVREYREGRYERGRGRLRSWLLSIARTRVAMVYRKRPAGGGRGESAMVNLADDATMTRIWDSERRTFILRQALEELRSRTRTTDRSIRVFEMLVLRQVPVLEIARELEMTPDEVYVSKSRIAKRLRTIIEELVRVFDEEPG